MGNKKQKAADIRNKRGYRQRKPGSTKKWMIANASLGAVVMLLCVWIYGAEQHPVYAGTPYTAAVGGCAVEPGKTTMQDFYDAGFILSDLVKHKDSLERNDSDSTVIYLPYDVKAPAEPSTYYHGIGMSQDEKGTVRYYGFLLVRDGQVYADISAINEYSAAGTLGDLVVCGISVYDTYQAADTAQLEGISMGNLSAEALAAAAGEPAGRMDGTAGYVWWEDGIYSAELSLKEDGTVRSFSTCYKDE